MEYTRPLTMANVWRWALSKFGYALFYYNVSEIEGIVVVLLVRGENVRIKIIDPPHNARYATPYSYDLWSVFQFSCYFL